MKKFKALIVLLMLALLVTAAACGGGNEQPGSVTVNFVNYDGSFLYGAEVEAGTAPVYGGEKPVRTADGPEVTYTFAGWEMEGYVYTEELPIVRKNTVFTASYTSSPATYTVVFAVGEQRTSAVYEYGATPVYTGETQIEQDGVLYAIVGWDKPFGPVTGNTVYTAQLREVSLTANVTFDVDGELFSVRVGMGEVPRFYGTPYRRATEDKTWSFVGWHTADSDVLLTELPAATGDVTYYAAFNAVPRTVHATFTDYDGTLLYETDVNYGEVPVYAGEALSRVGNDMYDFTFRAWDCDGEEFISLPALREDAAFTALYVHTPRHYTLTVTYRENDVTVGSYSETLSAGDEYYVPTPVREGKAADRPVVAGALIADTAVEVCYLSVSVWDGTVATAYSSGSGTASAPYVISSAAELAYLASQSRTDALVGKYFTLNCDIDLAGIPWSPVGSNACPFAGVLDGAGHAVFGLNRNSTVTESVANSGHGLISTSSGTVKDLTVSGTVSSVPRYTGIVVGFNKGGRVEGCTAYGSVTGYGNVGGVVGYSTGVIENCVNYAEVHDNGNVNCYRFGGVVGTITDNTDGEAVSGSIKGCENRGSVLVHAGNGRVGGIVGHVEGTGTVEDCKNFGYVLYDKQIAASAMTYTGGCVGIASNPLVTRCENYGLVEGADRIGGVLGWTRPTKTQDCKNFGTVLGTTYVGGVVGVSRSTVERSENHGTVRASAAYCGGVVASLLGSASDCVNYADLYSAGSSFGGVVGSLGTEAGMVEARLTSCINYGRLQSSCTSANVTTGGIAGRSDSIVSSAIYATVEDCENYGKVHASGSYVGGIIGACNGAKIEGCTNRGTVYGGIGAYVGGIAGSNYGYGSVEGCRNYATVLGGSTVGGICGQLTSTSTATGNFDGGKTLFGK